MISLPQVIFTSYNFLICKKKWKLQLAVASRVSPFLFQHFQLEKSWSRTSEKPWRIHDYVTSWRHKRVVENTHNTHKLIPGQLSLTIDWIVKLHVSVGRFSMILRVLNAVKIARQLLAASFLKLLWKACVLPPQRPAGTGACAWHLMLTSPLRIPSITFILWC